MAQSLVAENRAEVQAALTKAEAQAQELRNLLAAFKPTEPSTDGSVIRFQKWDAGYSYAAIRAYTGSSHGQGIWYVTQDPARTGGQKVPPQTWDNLLAWIGERNFDSIEVLS